MCGTVEWRKGYDIALDAWEKVQVKYPHASLALIGRGWNTPYGQEIAKRSLDLRVNCYEQRGFKEFQKWMRGRDVLLCPSRDEGGYSQVLLQAQEMGKLVVAPYICGVMEQIQDITTGIVYGKGESLDMIIQSIIYGFPSYADMGKNARDWAHKNNSIKEHGDKWVELIERLT